MEDNQRDLMDRLLFPRSQEDWDEAKAENDALPREPGKFKVTTHGAPRATEPGEAACERCGAIVRWKGGVKFGDEDFCRNPAHKELSDCHMIHAHQVMDMPGLKACPYWKHRLWRARCKFGDKKIEQKYRSWKWKRRAKQERADPNRWLEFWRKSGNG